MLFIPVVTYSSKKEKKLSVHYLIVCIINDSWPFFFCFAVSAGEMRNDLYITLERGEFEKGGKSVARNVEITVSVLDADGQILKVNALDISVLVTKQQCF